MTISTLRPNGTIASDAGLTGAASAHAALNDDSDSSYLEFSASSSSGVLYAGDLGDLSLPAGAVIKELILNLRISLQSISPGVMKASLTDSATGNVFAIGSATIGWTSPTTLTLAIANASAVTDAMIDGAILGVLLEKTSGPVVVTRVYEAYVYVVVVEKPTLTVETPAETVTDTNQPVVSWISDLDGSGGAQTRYEVKVFTDAQYGAGGFNPATSSPTVSSDVTTSSASTWPADEILPDDTYRAYVRVAQTVNGSLHWSDWEYTEFDIDVAIPASPILIITNDPGNGRIIIVIDDPGGGDATTDYFELRREKIDSPIFGYEPVRQLEAGPIPYTGPGVTVYDYEAPNGASVQYQARALHDYSGALAGSDWTSHGGEWQSSNWWLKHPNRPNLNIPVTVHSFQSLRRAARQGVFQALGALRPVIVRDTRGPITGQITFRCDTRAAQDALDLILAYTDTLLLQGPVEENPPGYIDIGDHERQRWVDLAKADTTREILEFTVVARPPGDVVE